MDDENRFDDEKSFLKFWIVGCVAIAAVLALLAFPGRSAYRHFKEKHEAAQAQTFFSQGDYRNAFLSARLTLMLNSNNLPACRVMAELNDSAQSPATLDWWRRVVKLSPAITNQLQLAAAGLRYQGPPYPLTTQLLNDLSQSADQLPDYHIVSAELALALHNMAEAQTQFEAASRLDPTNQLFQLNLAVIRLASTNTAAAAEARATLKQFSTDAKLGPPALRSLIADRLLHADAPAALDYSTQLLASAQANAGDRLQHLGILQQLKSADFLPQLKSVQQASTNAAAISQAASWMTANGFSANTILWLTNLPASLQTQTPVRLALVDALIARTNWTALRDFTSQGDWGDMEFVRQALLSRAWGKLGEPLMADGDWNSAVSLTENQLGALNTLLQLAGQWGMKSQQENLLWRIVRQFPVERWASQELERQYFAAGDTQKLNQLYTALFASYPKNAIIENNLAATSLLLKTNLTQAYQLAAEAYALATNYPPIVSTYAYALHLQGRDTDGLALLQKLDPSALEQPSVALCYGVLLTALGENEKAAPYLAIAETSGQLLPEEKQTLDRLLKAR